LANGDGEELAEKLAKAAVAVRAGLHCAPLAHESAGTAETGTVRVSFGWANQEADVERFLKTLEKLRRK
jgi:selenocysteine lyase/cysteine desulfurase